MSSAKNLIINCGASHVTAAVFSNNGQKLVLEDIRHQPLDYDLSQEDQWLYAVSAALREIASSGRFKGPATLIAPGYLLLTKTIKVPHVEEARRAQIIAFEAQQNIPYPLDEVVWDHQVIADDGVETEVTLIAVKAEAMDAFCRQVVEFGIKPVRVQASSILDYNAFQYNYGELDGDSLVINIGARSSNLLFVGDDGFYVRNISIGGNSLTQSLADHLGKPFVQAETVKTAFYSGQTSFSQDDSAGQILQTNAESFQKRLSQEVTRSIVNYRRQKKGKAPARILLTGRGAQLPGLAEALAETQKVAVEYFDATQNLEIGSRVDAAELQAVSANLSELVGEASRQFVPNGVGIDLLPAEISREQAFQGKKFFLLGAAVLLALSATPLVLHYAQAASLYEQRQHAIESRTQPLQKLQSEIRSQRQQAEQIEKNIAQIEGLVDSKSNWINFFSDLQERLLAVEDVWLEDLAVERSATDTARSYRLRLSGRLLIRDFDPDNPDAFDARRASARVNRLLESFTESDFIESVESVQFDTSDRRILRFNFALVVNQDKPL